MQPKGWLPLLAAFLAVTWTASAQRGSNWRSYKAADGLPETLTTAVSVGPRGNIWVRHPDVEWIARLDGYNVQAIPAPGLGNNRVYESPSGQLWTFSAGELQQYRDIAKGWTHYPTPEITAALRRSNLSPFWPLELFPLKKDEILILLPDGLMEFIANDRAHPRTFTLRAASQTGLQKFSNLCAAHDGGLWIAGENGLAKIFGPARNLTPDTPWQEYLLPSSLQIHNLHRPVEDDAGGITVVADSVTGNKTVAAYFDGQNWSIQARPEDKIIQAWRSADGSFWVAAFHSLAQYRQNKVWVDYTEETPRRNFDIATQTNGIFWLATSDGLLRYAPLTWQVPPGVEVSNSFIRSITGDASGRLWVYSADTLQMYQGDMWTNYPLPAEPSRNASSVRSLFTLTNGMVVLETGSGLLQFNPQSGSFDSITDHGQAAVRPLGLLKNGALCVRVADASGQSGLLQIFDGTNFTAFPDPPPPPIVTGHFRFLFDSPNSGLWLANSEGLAWYHDKKWQTFAAATLGMSESPRGMLEISDGRIWCGVQDKIMEFNGQTWTPVHAGFYHVNSMLKARDGSIWVASDNGLHRFYHGAWSANDMEEGLPSATVNGVYEDNRGQIWAATARGLRLYHPEADPDPPKTEVQNLPDSNNNVREGALITISFGGEDKWKYTPADRLLFSYRLDGQDWSPYHEQRSATFLDLPAGKHSFHVRSLDRNWNVDPTPALLEFAVTVPWYREARLLLISAAGLGLAVFFAGLAFNRHRRLLRSYAEVEAKVALRTQQLELANRELFHSQKMNALGTLAAGIAHDFNNILSIIKGSAQIIEDNLENTDKIRTRADRIKTVVEQGAGIVKAMLGFSRGSDRQLTLCDVVAVVQETITLLGDRFLREIEVQFTPPAAPLPEVPASKDFIQQILLNFIFNAAEATTDRRQVIITTTRSGQLPRALALKPAVAADYVFISVKDLGSGIAPDVMPRIFEPFFTTKALSARRGTGLGLSMAYELARQMDCGLHVQSAPGEGSVFTLIIPVRDLRVAMPGKS